jgi:hypothetical protein
MGVGHAGKKGLEWLAKYRPNVSFSYPSDLWRYSLDSIVPIAEQFFDALERGSGDILLYHLTVEKTVLDVLLEGAQTEQRLLFLAAYLDYLAKWQTEQALSTQRFPAYFEWGDKLGPLVERFRSQR